MSETWLDLKRLVRNPPYLIFALGMPVGFYLLYSAMYGSAQPIAHTTWGAYFLISMVTFGALGTTLNVTGTQIAMERGLGWQRFLRLTPLSGVQYTASKLMTAMVGSLTVIILVTAAAGLKGVPLLSLHVLPADLAIWLGSVAFAAVGLFLGQVFEASTVQYAVTVVYLAGGFLGGLWAPLRILPPVFTAIARVTPSYRIAELGWGILSHQAPLAITYIVIAAYLVVFGVVGGAVYARGEVRRP
jgi:ABC-2 type transport system permease protein